MNDACEVYAASNQFQKGKYIHRQTSTTSQRESCFFSEATHSTRVLSKETIHLQKVLDIL